MRKILCVFALFAMVATMCFFVTDKNIIANAEGVGYAEYVSVANAPIVDGEIDDVWASVDSNIETFLTDDGTGGNIKILWNETGLYFYATVIDPTTNAWDRCNFWVSEKFFEEKNGEYYPNVDGAWYLCINPQGRNLYSAVFGYSTVDIEGKYVVTTKITEVGYNIELFVSRTGQTDLKEGNSIGFEVSVDSYLEEGFERESYAYWKGLGTYWEKPSHLGQVVLIDEDKNNGSPNVKIEEGNSSESSDKNIEINSTNQAVTATNCSASVSTSSFVAIVLLFAIKLVKKD